MATSWACADFLRATQGPLKRLFYVQDLEWTRGHGRYEDWYRVYGEPSLRMLARGDDHAKTLSLAWNRRFTPIPYFNMQSILEEACRPG